MILDSILIMKIEAIFGRSIIKKMDHTNASTTKPKNTRGDVMQ